MSGEGGGGAAPPAEGSAETETRDPDLGGESSATSDRARSTSTRWASAFDPALGVLLAIVVLGPGLRPGPLLNLDLLVTPEIPVPNGIYGLGPALSQRVPLFVLFGVLSPLVGGPAATKLFFVGCIAAGFVGMTRLAARGAGPIAARAAAVLWVAGPFLLTRLSVGHLPFVFLVAVLPWVVGPLLEPARRPRHTFLAMAALAFGGPATGTLGLAIALVGFLAGRARRPLAVAAAVGIPTLLWAAPTVVLLWAGARVTGAGRFPTAANGVSGWLALPAGGGFWIPVLQVGATGAVAAGFGVGVVALAAFGARRTAGGKVLAAVGVLGIVLAVASAVPGVRRVYGGLSDLPFGAPLRESHRFLVLWLLWAAPAAAAGATRLGDLLAGRVDRRRSTRPGPVPRQVLAAAPSAVFAVAVLALSAGGWWGMHGALRPVTIPAGWFEARDLVRAEPGTTVVLPWTEYPPLSFLPPGRNAFNPVPDVLGGDTISSYNPALGDGRQQEQVDRRAWYLDDALAGQEPLGPAFRAVGARWVVLVHQKGAPADAVRLDGDTAAFTLVLRNPDVSVYRVAGWQGTVTEPDGRTSDFDRPIPPLITTDAPPGSTLDVAGAPGWVRGWFHPASITASGRLRLPGSGGGPVWFWPAPVLVGIDGAIAIASAVMLGRIRRREV